MKQRKIPSKPQNKSNNLTLQEYLNKYDSVTLIKVIQSLENDMVWQVFKAYTQQVQRQYEVTALDRMGKDGEEKAAAYASGYAKCAEDMQNDFVIGLRNTILNVNPVIENVRPEESEV